MGNHTLFCLILSFFLYWFGWVCMRGSRLCLVFSLAGLGGCVCEGASPTSFNLFVCFFFYFLKLFCGGSGLGVYVGEHALLSFVCRRAYNLRSVPD